MNHKEIERWHRLRNIKKASQVFVLATVLLLASGYAVSWYFHEVPEFSVPPALQGSGMRIDNFSYSSPGARPWELKAHTALVSENLDNVSLIKPKVLYRGGRGGEIFLSAESGKLDKNSRNVLAKGDVTVTYRDLLFTAGHIDYSDQTKIAETSSSVALDGGDLRVTGKGLKLSIENEEMVIEHDVKACISNVHIVGPKGKLPL
ncbi:MAG TPA: LPS export ABC transporter periplasmic protein LptC [Desulfomonilaceae bacterium]|nr:LPS export ABC transporter periplasmic protein LptC [Desulfomonilaceae bacterium]